MKKSLFTLIIAAFGILAVNAQFDPGQFDPGQFGQFNPGQFGGGQFGGGQFGGPGGGQFNPGQFGGPGGGQFNTGQFGGGQFGPGPQFDPSQFGQFGPGPGQPAAAQADAGRDKAVVAQPPADPSKAGYTIPGGKKIYIPEELRDNDFTSRDSKWSYYRMACTPNVVCFWEKGFGDDISKAPPLNGKNMTVDIDNLLSRVEYFYNTYRDVMGFLLPGSKAEKYRMMVMINYSLEGTAYGGSYDGTIGALWVAPNRIQDKTLNCIAHELGHCFQIQISSDGKGGGGGGGVIETSAQWMLWNVNPKWTTDENYHWEDYKRNIHLNLFNGQNMYHAPFVLEYWSFLHGKTYMADMFRGGRGGEDFTQTYMRMYNVDVKKMGDELLDCYSRLITFDFPDKRKESLRYACELNTALRDAGNGWKTPANPPQTYGFNVDEITLPAKGQSVNVQFKAMSDKDNVGYRYGLVAVDNDNNPTYLGANSEPEKTLTYTNPGNIKHLYLVVVGCPTKSYASGRGNSYPYQIKF